MGRSWRFHQDLPINQMQKPAKLDFVRQKNQITSAINQTMLFDGSGQSRFAPQHLHFGESYLTHHHSLGALGDKISAGDSLARCVVQYWSPPLATYRVSVSCPPVFSMGRQRNPRPSRPRHLNLLAIRSCEHEA
jgi:hypothetical protein